MKKGGFRKGGLVRGKVYDGCEMTCGPAGECTGYLSSRVGGTCHVVSTYCDIWSHDLRNVNDLADVKWVGDEIERVCLCVCVDIFISRE